MDARGLDVGIDRPGNAGNFDGLSKATMFQGGGRSGRHDEAPLHRALQVYAFDPSLDLELATARVNQSTIRVRWEALGRGPVGEYVEVVDVDPASKCAYSPVDLNDP